MSKIEATEAKVKKSNRLLVFQALARSGELTNLQIRKAIGMADNNGQLGVILRGEIIAGAIQSERHDTNGEDTIFYSLTAKGKERYEKGTVDSYAKEHHLAARGRNND